ncbi:MAG: hypothetical protein ACHQZQ_02715 [SAR324 cluster bacterium]
MQLFIDIDGVVLDFERSFVAWLNAKYGMRLPEGYQTNSWAFDEIMDAAELDRRWRLYLASPEAGRMTPLIDPPRFNALADAHDVHLVTNFPLPHWEKRVRNLDELGIRYASISHCGFLVFDDTPPKSKSQVVRELRTQSEPALFLDDHPDNCLDVVRNCPDVEVWLMTRRFNLGFTHPEVRRAEDWGSVLLRVAAEA